MNDINCPECGKIFKIDESGYANILKQIKDEEFEQALEKRLQLDEKDKLKSIELAKKNIEMERRSSSSFFCAYSWEKHRYFFLVFLVVISKLIYQVTFI